MNGDTIDACNSQGFVNQLEGNIEQYGDRNHIETGGGDVAKRDIYKQNITFNLFSGEANSKNIHNKECLQDIDFSNLFNAIDPENIRKAYRDTLHRDDAHLWSSETAELVEMLNNLDEFRRLPDFFNCLSQEPNIAPQVQKDLQEIAKKFVAENNIKSTTKTTNHLSCNKLESYLLATLKSSDSNEKEYLLNAWLIVDNSVEGLAKFESLLDGNEQQQGILCKLDRVPLQLNKFLEKSLKLLRGKRYHLTIEFFLPIPLMCTEIDRWKIDDPIDDELKLGIKYPIRLRSLERLDMGYLDNYHSDWCDRWDKVKDVLNSEPIAELFEHLDRMDSFNWREWKCKLKEKIGLKLTCAPPKPKQKDLFKAILAAATPIAIWTRCDILHLDREAIIDNLLSVGLLCDFCERVRKMREAADAQTEEHLGLHLAVLWENPYRLTPDVDKVFIEPRQE